MASWGALMPTRTPNQGAGLGFGCGAEFRQGVLSKRVYTVRWDTGGQDMQVRLSVPSRGTLREEAGVRSGKRLEHPKGHAGEGEPCQRELPWGQTSPGPWGAQANSSWQQARGMEQTRGSRD